MLIKREFFFCVCVIKLLIHINFKPKAQWAAIGDPTHHAFGERLDLAVYGKKKLFEKSWHVSWLVCVPRHSSISTFIMGRQDKTTAVIAFCLMLQSSNSFICRWFFFVTTCRAVVEKANHWEDDSWQLWLVRFTLELLPPEHKCVCQLTVPHCISELMKCS